MRHRIAILFPRRPHIRMLEKRQWKMDVDLPPGGWIGADFTLYRGRKQSLLPFSLLILGLVIRPTRK